jgi:DNA-binding SARP family transcriptional activator
MDQQHKLRLLLLGPPAIYLGESSLHVQRRSLRTLLFYLGYQNSSISRAKLTLLFWPDESEPEARRHLREVLSKLRAELPDPNMLITEQDTVSLDHNRVYVDALEFTHLLQNAGTQHLELNGLPLDETVLQKFHKALSLWRSPRFMAGAHLSDSIEIDRWMLNTAQVLEQSRQRLVERLADHYAATGNQDAAIHWLHVALEEDEFNPELHNRLVSTLRSFGRMGEALNYAKSLEELYLREGLGALPRTLKVLVDQVRSESAGPHGYQRTPWPLLPATQIPFVGRGQILQELQSLCQQNGAVMILGEAGSGKTRLIGELYQRLDPRTRLVLLRCHPLENALPLQPWIDWARQSVSKEEWQLLDPIWIKTLSRLLPELPDLLADRPFPSMPAPENSRSLMFESLYHLLLHLSQQNQLLFVLDDAQWCDESSLAAISFLLERGFFNENGPLVMAARVEEANQTLNAFLERGRTAASIRQLYLEELDLSETIELAHHALGYSPSISFAKHLIMETGGNPLFLLETLRILLQSAQNVTEELPPTHLPLAGSLRALMRDRLRNLRPQTRQVLVTAAVIGNEFTMRILQEAAQVPVDDLVDALEELEKSHLIRPAHEKTLTESYVFIHDKIREVLLAELSQARRQTLHLKVANALETRAVDDARQAAVLAGHYEEGGELELAFHHWLEAGDHAMQLLSPGEAYAAYRHALELLRQIETHLSDHDIYRLFTEWGQLAIDLADFPTTQLCFTTLLQIGNRRNQPLLIGSAYSGLAMFKLLQNDPEEAKALLDKADSLLEQCDNCLECLIASLRRGTTAVYQMQYPEAMRVFESALQICANDDSPQMRETQRNIEIQLSLVYVFNGWPERAVEVSGRVRNVSSDNGNSGSLQRSYLMTSVAQYCLGDYTGAKETASTGLELAQSLHSWQSASMLEMSLGRSLLQMGDVDGALVQVRNAIALAHQYHFTETESESLSILGDVHLMLHNYNEAAKIYTKGMELNPPGFVAMENLYRSGYARYRVNSDVAGIESLEHCIQTARKLGLWLIVLPAELCRALVDFLGEKSEAARQRLDDVAKEAELRKIILLPVEPEWLRSRLAWQEGNLEAADGFARSLIQKGRRLHNLWFEISGNRLLLEHAHTQVESDQAVGELKRSLDALDAHCHDREFRPVFLRFRQSMLKR